jgi:hypothetical protein
MMASVPNRPGRSQENDAAHSKDGLGGLVAAGPSRVGIDGAMRARDVARPSAADLAAAEKELVIRHAAQRTESRPLPQGILPATTPDRTEAKQPQLRPHNPVPHPPKPKSPDQDMGGDPRTTRKLAESPSPQTPGDTTGSSPERS